MSKVSPTTSCCRSELIVNNKSKRQKLGRVVARLTTAEVAVSWIGQQPPSERPEIRAEANSARREFNKLMRELFPDEEVIK